MHREKREYFRPADHHGPETVLVGGVKRVKRGEAFSLHTSDQEHAGLLTDGYQSTMVSTAVPIEPEPAIDPQPEQFAAATPRRKKGEADA